MIEFYQTLISTHTTLASETTAQTGVQQNDDMRKITAWVAIVTVRTAVTGYFGSTVLIVAFALILFILFERNGWL